jgi:speckle-type POZ protein
MAYNLPRPSTRTASRCTPRTSRGTHAFEVAGYSLHRGLGVNNFVRSAAFDVGGYSWCIRFFPDGYVDDEEHSKEDDNVAAFLELLSENAEVRAHYDFRLVEHATGSSCSVYSTAVPQVFDTLDVREVNCYAWGADKLMERSKLEESVYLLDDRLVIECDVTVFMEPLVEERVVRSDDNNEVSPSDLSSSLGA